MLIGWGSTQWKTISLAIGPHSLAEPAVEAEGVFKVEAAC